MPVLSLSASSAAAAPRELMSGIDTIEATCKTPAPVALLDELAELKLAAGESPRLAIPFPVGDSTLRVMPSGMGRPYRFRLDHQLGQLGVGDMPNRPAWKLSMSSEGIHRLGASAALRFWRSIIEALTGIEVVLMCSRLDVHADFAGLDIKQSDLASFVCRSTRQSLEIDDGELETFYWAKGGPIMTRGYDKRAEIKAKGGSGLILDAYAAAGLQDDESVQRFECQVRGPALRTLGVSTAEEAIAAAGAVYGYVTGKWLRLVDPSSASRSWRAKLDPRWVAVQAARISAEPAVRNSPERVNPRLETVVANVFGWLESAGVCLGVSDLSAVLEQLKPRLYGYEERAGRDFAAEVRARRLDLGTV